MSPPKVGGQPTTPKPIATREAAPAKPPTPVVVAQAPAKPRGRSNVFDTRKPQAAKPPPPPPFQELGKNLAGATGNQVMPSKTGPIPASAWSNPTEIVGNLRQDTGRPGDVSGDDRCGPTNLLAGALLQGKDKAAGLLAAASKSKNLTPDQKTKLAEIGKAVGNGTASYDQLNEATSLMYQAANTRVSFNEIKSDPSFDVTKLGGDLEKYRALARKSPDLSTNEARELGRLYTLATGKPTTVQIEKDPRDPSKKAAFVKIDGARPGDHSGLDDGELQAYAKSIGLSTKSKPIDVAGKEDGAEVTGTMISKMKKGESTVLRVGLTGADSDPNHFVTVGRLPDGRPYIYNPSPGAQGATLTIGSVKPPQPDEFVQAQDKIDTRIHKDGDGATPRTLKVD